jgi:hypothetical protein
MIGQLFSRHKQLAKAAKKNRLETGSFLRVSEFFRFDRRFWRVPELFQGLYQLKQIVRVQVDHQVNLLCSCRWSRSGQ